MIASIDLIFLNEVSVGIKVGRNFHGRLVRYAYTEALHVVERYRLVDDEAANESAGARPLIFTLR